MTDIQPITNDRSKLGNLSRMISTIAGVALLASALKRKPKMAETAIAGYLIYRGISGQCPLSSIGKKITGKSMNINIRASQIVNKPVDEVYAFWRKLENLPLFMDHLEDVKVLGNSSEWKAKAGPGTIQWRAVIVNEKENEVLGWSSIEKSAIYNAGKVEFEAVSDSATNIDVTITYRAPLGAIGENIARMFTPSFENIVRNDIKNFKQYIETGFTQTHLTDFRNELI